ncbi:uncharacterized protein BJ171DRAFT_600418 [Polychytrium aggregatum]|uniref:uncharacterized protein n=1 Tax=Polychytrium aggregatum TaxID=110093 RepID=UPI0022FEFF07|nr:uncharacterized protein BJ171DRAFT_600418 [Polychytrium aggregatum]KAI9202969.1 hypothetical protein BJ171DRAFT_600418 [Polychytrium aggregatum]
MALSNDSRHQIRLDIVNPAVLTPDDEVDEFMNGYLSENKLRTMTGMKDLRKVKTMELQADVRRTSLSNLGKWIPNIQQLKLNHSYIPTIRDMGVGFSCLSILWMSQCDLVELDGIGSLSLLKELYLSYNAIQDLSSLSMLDCLEILDLEGNCIDDYDQIENLALCPLQELTLQNNPIFDNPEQTDEPLQRSREQEEYREALYRHKIATTLPDLKLLDDKRITSAEMNHPPCRPGSANLWAMRSDKGATSEIKSESTDATESSSRPRSVSSGRPKSAPLNPFAAGGLNKYFPDSDDDASSSFTHGTAICEAKAIGGVCGSHAVAVDEIREAKLYRQSLAYTSAWWSSCIAKLVFAETPDTRSSHRAWVAGLSRGRQQSPNEPSFKQRRRQR